jgi:hypothetical protein
MKRGAQARHQVRGGAISGTPKRMRKPAMSRAAVREIRPVIWYHSWNPQQQPSSGRPRADLTLDTLLLTLLENKQSPAQPGGAGGQRDGQ